MTEENKEVTTVGEVEEVIDVLKDSTLVQEWYNEAREVKDIEGLQKLSERVLGTSAMTSATTPHAYTSIALAALKMASLSKHGKLDTNQWMDVLMIMREAIDGRQQ